MKKIIMLIFTTIALFTVCITGYAEDVSEEASDNAVIIDTSKIGDVNNDGKITTSDARLTLRVAANLDVETEDFLLYGDIDKDGRISASDARTILRIAANLDDINCIVYGHDMTDKVVKPTCTKKGYTTNGCTRCSYTDGTKTNIISKTDHNYSLDSSVKATCKSEGYDSYKCTVCGVTKKENIQPKTEHSFKKGSVIKGTCVSDGYTEYKCSTCGTVEKRDITKAGGHKYELISEKRITENGFDGFKEQKVCKYCNNTITTYTTTNANYQIPTVPISSDAAKNIQKKFEHYDYKVEGYDITGKKVVIYGTMKGIDVDGYYYNLDGTLQGACPHCGTTLGLGRNMCNGRCYLSWG